ncbi:hypothetical protein KJ975_09040, partial [Myxococcota bacterium]|nr:hypothetical protein [Myxococcota bacterium]
QFENAQEAARVASRGFIPAGPPGGLRSKRRGCPTTGPSSAMGILNRCYEKSFAYVHNDLALAGAPVLTSVEGIMDTAPGTSEVNHADDDPDCSAVDDVERL